MQKESVFLTSKHNLSVRLRKAQAHGTCDTFLSLLFGENMAHIGKNLIKKPQVLSVYLFTLLNSTKFSELVYVRLDIRFKSFVIIYQEANVSTFLLEKKKIQDPILSSVTETTIFLF